MNGGESKWNVGDWHIPTLVAVVVWFGSALAVLGYTLIAFKETAGGVSALDASPPGQGAVKNPSLLKMLPKLPKLGSGLVKGLTKAEREALNKLIPVNQLPGATNFPNKPKSGGAPK